MKAALHRSLTFWFGLLVMVFVCLAWWDSERLRTGAGSQPILIYNVWGGLLVAHRPDPFPHAKFEFERESLGTYYNHLPETFPAPLFLRGSDVLEDEQLDLRNRLVDSEAPQGLSPASYTLHESVQLILNAGSSKEGVIVLPHWLILLTVAAVWLGLLFLRARRRNKITQ